MHLVSTTIPPKLTLLKALFTCSTAWLLFSQGRNRCCARKEKEVMALAFSPMECPFSGFTEPTGSCLMLVHNWGWWSEEKQCGKLRSLSPGGTQKFAGLGDSLGVGLLTQILQS